MSGQANSGWALLLAAALFGLPGCAASLPKAEVLGARFIPQAQLPPDRRSAYYHPGLIEIRLRTRQSLRHLAEWSDGGVWAHGENCAEGRGSSEVSGWVEPLHGLNRFAKEKSTSVETETRDEAGFLYTAYLRANFSSPLSPGASATGSLSKAAIKRDGLCLRMGAGRMWTGGPSRVVGPIPIAPFADRLIYLEDGAPPR